MFNNEKMFVVDIKDRGLKLMDGGRVVSLIFIKDDKLIIRGELEVLESSIVPPEIKNIK
jgi:hypothetical protein